MKNDGQIMVILFGIMVAMIFASILWLIFVLI